MINVQEYLKTHTLDDLTKEFAVKQHHHKEFPLVILNYSQFESPKFNKITNECRGLVLDKTDNSVVAKAFDRFYNWGEVDKQMKLFNWGDFTCQSKEDGSLILLYFYKDQWRVNTRNSFGDGHDGKLMENGGRWDEMVFSLLDTAGLPQLSTKSTYIFELCTEHNPVIRKYGTPTLYLLSAINAKNIEHSIDYCDMAATWLKVKRPDTHHFHSIDEIMKWLVNNSEKDPTFEGVIVRDNNDYRWKIKSKTYQLYARIYNNGETNPRELLPFILNDTIDSLIVHLPGLKDLVAHIKHHVRLKTIDVQKVWDYTKDIPTQKDFALAVKEHPMSPILFESRKTKEEPGYVIARNVDFLHKHLKETGVY